MSRSSAAFEYAPIPANDTSAEYGFGSTEEPTRPAWAEDKNPTRPLPVFRLEEEARRLDQAAEESAQKAAALAATRCDDDATVMVSAADNERLLVSIFPGAAPDKMPSPLGDRDLRCTDDEPTLDAPVPSSPEALAAISVARPVRVTARPPALKMLVITRPPPPPHTPRSSVAPDAPSRAVPVVEPRESGFHSTIAPELALAARGRRDAEEDRRSGATFTIRLPRPDATTYVVAGIWAMALSLIVFLMLMVTSA